MTQLLQKAIAEVQRLPESEQDALAAILLDEIEDQRRWDEAFAGSQDQLAQLAAKVREDICAGRVKKFGVDEL